MKTYHVEIITPCFCSGADQSRAEIRVPSIRGQLRWWFRALGGTAEEEKAVFGGVHALQGEKREESAKSSALVVRVSDVIKGKPWIPFSMNMGTPGAYIWYFASVSGDKHRWWRTPPQRARGQPPRPGQSNPDGHLPPGTTFDLHIGVRRPLDPSLQRKCDAALEAYLRFGALGMRATRCLGDMSCREFPSDRTSYEQAGEALRHAGFAVRWHSRKFLTWEDAVFEAERQLKALRELYNANKHPHSPLGNSTPRQMSAIWLRVVKLGEDAYGLVLFEAPHDLVLEPQSQTKRPVLEAFTVG